MKDLKDRVKESKRTFYQEIRRLKKKIDYERKIADLNPVLMKRYGKAYAHGLLDACNVANDLSLGRSDNLIGDMVLAKLNWLKRGKRVRKTKQPD